MSRRRPIDFKFFLCFLLLLITDPCRCHDSKDEDNVKGVRYDGRSLHVNGKRMLLFSGSIHYPRSTPDMWPELIARAKHGGLNLIQTYVFWNAHEPVQGKYYFKGRYDLIKFLKVIQKQGLFVTLRIGPFIEAEWNYGGFPYWLRDVQNITFRSDNPPFKVCEDDNMFAQQGGPIIMSQIENEYDNVKLAFHESGVNYVQWAGTMAVGLNTGVPWIMCKQRDAPDPVINACNGRYCGDTFGGPNTPNKPSLWTENWTAQYRVFGDPPSQRSAEDIALAVARFFSKNGTHVNYYMYHGGTNFGRTASTYATTRYYDEAPLDEYGLYKEPKWGHLRDLHSALKLCRKALLWGTPSAFFMGDQLEARVYEVAGSNVCAAFLLNNRTREAVTVNFKNHVYYLPPHSISILPDCKTVVFNSAKVNSQHNFRTFTDSAEANQGSQWQMYKEEIPKPEEGSIHTDKLLEHMNLTKDTTDYVWYTINLDVSYKEISTMSDIRPVLHIASAGHALHAFVNDKYIGSGHGSSVDKTFLFDKATPVVSGRNKISIPSMTVGLPDNGAYLEHRIAGPTVVSVQGLKSGIQELTRSVWGHQIGIKGEKFEIYKEEGTKKVQWSDAKKYINQPITWYKRIFHAPSGKDPVILELSSMGKGQVWINGESIGRYWVSYLTPLGKPSQSQYHVPRSFLKPTGNLMVVFEETGGDPYKISVQTVNRDIICGYVSEAHPPTVKSWERRESEIRAVVTGDLKPRMHLTCEGQKVFTSIDFASFGNPLGICGNFTMGNCTAASSRSIVEKTCLGKKTCAISTLTENFGGDPCPGATKILAVQAQCSERKSPA